MPESKQSVQNCTPCRGISSIASVAACVRMGKRVYLKQGRRNQEHVSVRTNRRNGPTKKSNPKELLTASRRYPVKHESVGLHRTLEQEVRDYVADLRQSRRTVPGRQGGFQGVPIGHADGSESAFHRTGGIADFHYLQLADQMLKQGTYKRLFSKSHYPLTSVAFWAPHRHG